MALLSWRDQHKISAQEVIPERSAAVANTPSGLATVKRLDVRSTGAARDINWTRNEYVLTIPPGTAAQAGVADIRNAKIGDVCHVFIKDDADTNTEPRGYAMFIYNTTVTAAGAVSGTASWRLVTLSA